MAHHTRGSRRVLQGEEGEEGTLEQQVMLLRRELQDLRSASLTPGSEAAQRIQGASSDPREGANRGPTLRLRPIPIFTGRSLREHREHIQGAVTHFNALGELNERRRVAVAANALQGDALDDWFRLGEDQPSLWTGYEAITRGFVQSQETRMGSALLALKNARQGQQTVRELAHYLENQWDDIPEMSLEEQKAWALVNALNSELRTAVLREERVVRTRTQILSTALRIQELEGPSESSNRSQGAQSMRPASGTPATSGSAPEAGQARTETRTCHRCKQQGHLQRDCPEKARKV